MGLGCSLASSASEGVSASAATAISAAATAPPSAGLRGGGGGGGGGCRTRAFASRSPPPATATATSAFAAAVERFRGDRGWPPWTCRGCSRSSVAPRDACVRALASRRSSATTSPPSSVHATRACEHIGLQAGLHRVAACMAWGCSLRHIGLRVAAGTWCAPPAPRTPVRPAARAGPPVITCTPAAATRVGDCNFGPRLQSYCVGARGGRTSCRRDTASTWRAAAARVRALVRRASCSAASARASASVHLLPSCTALGPSSRRRASTSSRTCTRHRRQVRMVTTCMDARVHACRSAPPTRPRTAPSAAARGPRAAARPRPRPRAPRAPGTWGGSLGYMGSQPRVHGPQPLAH